MMDANQSTSNDKGTASNVLTTKKIDLKIALALIPIAVAFSGCSTQTTNLLLIIIFELMATTCFVIGIFFIWLCKKRVSDGRERTLKERFKQICPRCVGIVLGAVIPILPLITISTKFTPIFDANWKFMALIAGFLLAIPAISHGLYHGIQKKEVKGIDNFVSMLSGFLLSLGGYLVFLSLVLIFG